MATRLLVVADTHEPKRARDLPAQVWSELEGADLVIHAGDWVDEALLDEFEARARPTDRRGQPHCTYVTATADSGQLHDVTFHTVAR